MHTQQICLKKPDDKSGLLIENGGPVVFCNKFEVAPLIEDSIEMEQNNCWIRDGCRLWKHFVLKLQVIEGKKYVEGRRRRRRVNLKN